VLLSGTVKIMTSVNPARRPLHTADPARPARRRRAAAVLAGVCAALLAAGCATGHPKPITTAELAEAQTFPYFRVYWVGRSFDGHSLSAADGLRGYLDRIGTSVYYGDCVKSKGIFGGGTCELPLQVTTVIYRLHSNAPLGSQRNMIVRGVPATVYDSGRSIEIYSGRVAIDVFSDRFAHALKAADELTPLNAHSSTHGSLPLPVYCPGLSGSLGPKLMHVLKNLPGRVCQHVKEQTALATRLYS
jgi:hypothetical protein